SAFFARYEDAPRSHVPILRNQVVIVGADDAGGAVFATGDHRRTAAVHRSHRPQARNLLSNSVDVAILEAFGLGAGATRAPLAGAYEEGIGAEPRKFCLDLRRRAVSNRYHR